MEQGGVPMICATSVMKPGPTRIGRLVGGVTLPRTVPVVNLFAAGIGALLGVVLGMTFGSGFETVVVSGGISGGAGWMAVTYSPLKNESLLKWFELQFKSQTRTRYVNGRRVTVAVGVAVVRAPSSGAVRLARSAARVPVGQYDERGVVRSARNQNLDASDVTSYRTATVPHHGAVSLPGQNASGALHVSAPPAPLGTDSGPVDGRPRRLKD